MKKLSIFLLSILFLTSCAKITSEETNSSEPSDEKTSYKNEVLNISFEYPKEWGDVTTRTNADEWTLGFSEFATHFLRAQVTFLNKEQFDQEYPDRPPYWTDGSLYFTSEDKVEKFCDEKFKEKEINLEISKSSSTPGYYECSVMTNKNGIRMVQEETTVFGALTPTTQYHLYVPNTTHSGLTISAADMIRNASVNKHLVKVSDVDADTLEAQINELIQNLAFVSG